MTTAVDRVTVTTVADNYSDMLLLDEPNAKRLGLVHHFDPGMVNPRAENGIAFLVRTERDGRERCVLFDTSFTAGVLLHNFEATGRRLDDVSGIVISHGHPDHHGGLDGVLEAIGHEVPVVIHPDAFLPRYLRLPTGEVAPHYNYALTTDAIERRGGAITANRGAIEVVDGVFATGEIAREVPFEAPASPGCHDPGLFQLIDGSLGPDTVPDDQALAINVRGVGLVVLTGCSHAGVINTVECARRVTGEERVHAVMGGFHLGFPGIPASKTTATIAALRELTPRVVAPMHCTGMRAAMEIAREMPDEFLLNVVGTTVSFGASDA